MYNYHLNNISINKCVALIFRNMFFFVFRGESSTPGPPSVYVRHCVYVCNYDNDQGFLVCLGYHRPDSRMVMSKGISL